LLLAACIDGGASSVGTVIVETQGDIAVEDGLRATDLADGWSIAYERFVVNVGGVALGSEGVATTTLGSGPYALVDHVLPGPKPILVAEGVLAREWPSFTFTVRPARVTSELAGGASEDDLVKMRNLGASVWIKGTATKGAVTKSFDWVFTSSIAYEACRTTVGGRTVFGLDVEDDETTEVSLVFRGRTLFEDGIGASKPSLRFDAIADADVNADGVVGANELAAVPIAAVRTKYGFYGTGSITTVSTLRDFLDAQAQRLAAFQGAGTCVPRRL
jgi:hypothetical protein